MSHPTHSRHVRASTTTAGRCMLPGMSGVVANARVGDPGVPLGRRPPRAGRVGRLTPIAAAIRRCSSSPASATSCACSTGPPRAPTGTVTGKHAFVLVDFPQDALDVLAPGDRLLVRAHGQGLRLLDFPEIATRSSQPGAARGRWASQTTDDGRLRVEVAAEIPAYLMGAGLGMSSEWANCDVMFTRRETIERLGFERTCASATSSSWHDQDHRFGRGFRKGMSAIGVVAHGGYGGRSRPRHGRRHDPVRPERAARDRARRSGRTCASTSTFSN